LHILVVLIDVRKWLAVKRVIHVPSRVDEQPLSAIRLAGVGEHTRDDGSELSGRASSFLAHDWRVRKLLLLAEGTAALRISYNPSTHRGNKRALEKLIEIGLGAAARLPIIDGPCGCHPP
jgi:hypothetical protein